MPVHPIKVYKNGEVLMFMKEKYLIYYSSKTRTIRQVGMPIDGPSVYDVAPAMIYTLSLFSIMNFGVENVISF